MKLNIFWICFISLVIRFIFICFGSYLDGCDVGNLHYTDIDYHIFSDAALQVINGVSPYERSTYRYPPLLAILMTTNHKFAQFGKIIFCIADVGVVYIIYNLLRLSSSEKESINWSFIWAINPIAINICTRGSADSITNWLVLLSLFYILRGKSFWSGFVLGVAVHLRIYPVIYCPAFLAHLILLSANAPKLKVSPDDKKNHRIFCMAIFNCQRGVWFLFGVALTVASLTTASYHAYGSDFLEHAVFYHLSRSDHRHNFAPHFYGMYLSGAAPLGSSPSITAANSVSFSPSWCDALMATATSVIDQFGTVFGKVIFFIPQLVLFAGVIAVFARDQLAVCALLQTVVFVAYNKVITAQYFTWFLCLVPVCGPVLLRKVPRPVLWSTGALWICACLFWLGCAYRLEFLGENTFHLVWIASLVFHLANVICIAMVIKYS